MPVVPSLSIREHLDLAEAHTQKALDLARNVEPQSIYFQALLGRAASILKSLTDNIARITRR